MERNYTAYLFAYFTDNENEKLYYGISRDGYNYKSLNGGEPVFVSNIGTGGIRDPFVFRGEDGYFYIVATDMKCRLGWASQSTIAIFKSRDLIPKNGEFDDCILIDYKRFYGYETCNRAWAPQIVWCTEKDAYMIYLTLQCANTETSAGTVMCRHYARDLFDPETYTVPEIMINEDSVIDGDIIRDELHDRYIMYVSGRRITVSDSLTGNFRFLGDEIPFVTDSGERMLVEGSNAYRLIDKNKWIVCADGTPFNGRKYVMAETEDLTHYRQLSDGEYSFDFTPRHGYVIHITEEELSDIIAAFPIESISSKDSQ